MRLRIPGVNMAAEKEAVCGPDVSGSIGPTVATCRPTLGFQPRSAIMKIQLRP